MRRTKSRGNAAILASAAAGPVYVFLRCLFEYLRQPFQMPHMAMHEAPGLVLILPMIIAGGFILSIAFNLIGTLLMADAANESACARTPFAWIAAGGLTGTFIALPFSVGDDGIDPVIILSLTATSAVCAGLCWRSMGWSDESRDQG